MALIYLIRHGEAAAKWSEAPDPGLSALGREQANAVAQRMRAIGPLALVSSPLARARETAAPLAEFWHGTPAIEPSVAEIPSPPGKDRGAWLEWVLTGSWSQAGDAVIEWRRAIVEYLGGLEDDTVIFSHFVVINAAVGAATGNRRIVAFRPGNCSITILENDNGALRLIEQGGEAVSVVR